MILFHVLHQGVCIVADLITRSFACYQYYYYLKVRMKFIAFAMNQQARSN